MKYVHVTAVRKMVNSKGKKVSRGFLAALDSHIYKLLERATQIHNGGRKILDGALFEIIRRTV